MPRTARPPLASRLSAFGTSVFAEMTTLARQHGAVNLGQGYPDFDGPDFVKAAAVEAIQAGHNQYAPMPGLPAAAAGGGASTRSASTGSTTTRPPRSRSTPAPPRPCARRFAALLAPRRRGDRLRAVLRRLPARDRARAGEGRASCPSPRPTSGWTRRRSRRRSGPRTRLLVLNSPGNPSGRVFTREELAAIAAVCVKRDLLVVTDEVYEHIVFDGAHVPIASLPGMRERTVTISSAGKTFSLTGWKVGWTCAAARAGGRRALGAPVRHVRGRDALPARGRRRPRGPRRVLRRAARAEYLARRDRLCDGLADVGFAVRRPEGTYFALADIRPLGYDEDETFCRTLVERVGVAAIPVSAFVAEKRVRHLVRFAFCKDDATLDEGLRRLRRLKG